MIKKGDWVQIHVIVLEPEQRAASVPEDTHQLPLEMWVKGYMLNESAELGDTISVLTITGRTVEGRLCAVNPSYNHSFGNFIPELLEIDATVKGIVFGGDR